MNEALIRDTIDEFQAVLGDNEWQFLNRVYSGGIASYQDRLRQYGFERMDRVLDAGCGFGQWALALAGLNANVEALDDSSIRVVFIKELQKRLGLPGLKANKGTIERVPFSDGAFDGLWCYQALFLSDWRNTLREFHRVLKPGGLLYLNANSHGWYRFIWETSHNRTSDFDPRLTVAKAYMNTWRYENGHLIEKGAPIIIAPDDLENLLDSLGFKDIRRAKEGYANLPSDAVANPFLKGEYGGDLAVYEVLARKGS